MKKLFLYSSIVVFSLTLWVVSAVGAEEAPAKSQPQTPPAWRIEDKSLLRLSLQDCIDIAMHKSRLRAISSESIHIAEAQHAQALSGHWPQLKFGMTALRTDDDPNFVYPSLPLPLGSAGRPFAEAIANAQLSKMGITPTSVGLAAYNAALSSATDQAMNALSSSTSPAQTIKMMDRDLLTSSLTLIVPVYTGGRVSALAKQAKVGVDISKEESRRTDMEIVRDVRQYYYGHIIAKKLLLLGQETLDRFEGTLALTENVYKHGSGKTKKTDYLRTKLMTNALRTALEELKSNEELSRSALTNTMGLSWNTRIDVAESDIPFQPYNKDLAQLIEKAHQLNPQMKQVRLGIQAREAKISEARSGHLPIVALFGDTPNRMDNSYHGGIMTDENRNTWKIGISLEIPIFNGFRTSKEVSEARHRLKNSNRKACFCRKASLYRLKMHFCK